MSEDSTTSSWSIVDGTDNNENAAATIEEEDGSPLSTGVIVSTATEDDVISLFSTLDISDDDGISTSIATKSHPVVIPKCTSNLFQAELDALADSPDNDDHDDDDAAMDSHLLPPLRQGKRLLHHSLTRRDRSAPFLLPHPWCITTSTSRLCDETSTSKPVCTPRHRSTISSRAWRCQISSMVPAT